MPFLAFDTSTERLSIAVTDGQQVWSYEGEGGPQASVQLIGQVLDLLAQANLKLVDLDALVFGRGPGSFTGLRTACSVAQGLALGAGLPVLALDTLLAVAEEARHQHGCTRVLAALDARMDEVYAAAYEYQQGAWRAWPQGDAGVGPFFMGRPESLMLPVDEAQGAEWALAGTAGAVYGPRLVQLDGHLPCPGHAVWPTATALLRLAPQAWSLGQALTPEEAQPLYVRDKVAQTTLERAAEKAQKTASVVPSAKRPEAQLLSMTPAWLGRVMAIEQSVYSHPWSRGNFEDSLRAGYDMQVLVGGETLIGYFVAMKGVDESHLLNITVAKEFQGQGWGRLLLDAVRLQARGQGAAKLWLEVRTSNERAQAVYRRFGFQQVGVRKAYYAADVGHATAQGREDAMVMGLDLQP